MDNNSNVNDVGSSCCRGKRGNKSWILWIGLLVLAMFYLRSAGPVTTAVNWNNDMDTALAQAAKEQKPVFVKFSATWCGPCKKMDREVFSREDVAKALSGWVSANIDVDVYPKVAERYGVRSVPTLFLLDAKGTVLNKQNGTMGPDEFIRWIASARR